MFCADAKSDVTSEHTTPRTPRAADVTTSVSASSQGLNESRDEEKSSTPVTSSPRSDAVNERAVDVGDESFPEEERSFPVEVMLRHDGSLVTLTHDYYSLIFIFLGQGHPSHSQTQVSRSAGSGSQ